MVRPVMKVLIFRCAAGLILHGIDGVSVPRKTRDNGATLECSVEVDESFPEDLNLTIRWMRNGTELVNSEKHAINATVYGVSLLRVTKIGDGLAI